MDAKISQKSRDIINKYASGLFKDAALLFYGIKAAPIKELINVELPVVEVTDSSTDYIFLLEDDSYLHWEFQTKYNKKDLARFLGYDVRLYERDGKEIMTVIIYSAEVKEVASSLKIGSAVYNPQTVMMRDYDGNTIYAELEKKIKENKENLTDVDLMNLIFLPMMDHTIAKNELAIKSIELAQTIEDRSKRDICVASVVAFGSKYLNEAEKQNLLGALRMSDILDMLWEDGKLEGEKKGKLEAAKNMLKDNLPIDLIAKYINLDIDAIKQLATNNM